MVVFIPIPLLVVVVVSCRLCFRRKIQLNVQMCHHCCIFGIYFAFVPQKARLFCFSVCFYAQNNSGIRTQLSLQ